jgi:hypothetical protein
MAVALFVLLKAAPNLYNKIPSDPVFAQDLPGRGSVRLDSGTIDSYYFHVLAG